MSAAVIIGIIVAIVVVLILAAVGIWYFFIRVKNLPPVCANNWIIKSAPFYEKPFYEKICSEQQPAAVQKTASTGIQQPTGFTVQYTKPTTQFGWANGAQYKAVLVDPLSGEYGPESAVGTMSPNKNMTLPKLTWNYVPGHVLNVYGSSGGSFKLLGKAFEDPISHLFVFYDFTQP